ncbi:MAG: exodeoxyribonuclease VII large subunit, partial [Gammaproteobacteria bacterium]|nr:exodeoxyribonuclease VII large subunit [Gammaproteobacteria bacterium]
LSTLQRGYAIVRNAEGSVITNAAQTRPGQQITARFAENEITAAVIESEANKK